MARNNRNDTDTVRIPRTRSQREQQRKKRITLSTISEFFKKRYFGRFPLWLLCIAVVLFAAIIILIIIIPWQFIAMILGILSILVLAAYYFYMQKNQ